MKVSTQLVQVLKGLEIQAGYEREVRSLFVAQALAFQVPLNPTVLLSDAVDKYLPVHKQILNEINEYMVLDTKLCISQFERLLKARYEMMNGVGDLSLLKAGLRGTAVEHGMSPETNDAIRSLLSMPHFGDAQRSVSDLIRADVAAMTD